METIYELLFTPNFVQIGVEQKEPWTEMGGYNTGSIVLFAFTILTCVIFYLYFGNKSAKFSKRKHWFIGMFISFLLILCFSYFIIGLNIFESPSVGEISGEVTRFSIINGVYGIILYVLLSIPIKYLSKFSKYVPF